MRRPVTREHSSNVCQHNPKRGRDVRVWIDQDLCTGDGLCTDHCSDVFVILEDGISYVRDRTNVANDPGGASCLVQVAPYNEAAVVVAALDCPGECIFIES